MNHRKWILPLALMWPVIGSLQGAAPAPDKLLGVDTLAVCTVPDWTRTSQQFRQEPAWQFWNDPSMKPFRDKFMGRLQEDVIAPLEKELGIRFEDYQGLIRGQMTLALTRNGWGEKPDHEPSLLLLLDAGDQSESLKSKIAELKQKWIDGGKSLQTQTIRGVDFVALSVSSGKWGESLSRAFPGTEEEEDGTEPETEEVDPAEGEAKDTLLIGQSDTLLVVGGSAEDIEKVLARQSGGSLACLADNATFAAESGALFRQAQSYLWLNVNLLVNILLDQLSQGGAASDNPLMPAPGALVDALGLKGLESFAVALTEREGGSLVTTSILAPESKRKGLLKLFEMETKDCSPPAFIPADAVRFSRLRLNLSQTWNTLEQTLAQAYPPVAGVITMVLENAGKDEKNPDFDLRKSLIANLGDDVISYVKPPREMTLQGLNSPPTLTLIGSPRAEELAEAIRALGALMPQQGSGVKEREFLGRTIYSMPLPGGMSSDQQPIENNLHYVANGSYVAFSTDASLVEEFLRTGNGKPLRATPGLAQAIERIGGMNVGFLAYENQAESMRLAFEILRKESGTLANLFNNSGLAGRLGMGDENSKFKDWLDFSLLPPFERVAKYFHFTVSGGNVNSRGYTFHYFCPLPPQMR